MKEIQKKDKNVEFIEASSFECKISQAANPNGRRPVKIVLHEIYPDTTHWNENGITYLEKYTRDNAESVKGMPLCAQFLDSDMETPYGHGMTGRIKNMPTFEDSVQVGAFEDWSIEDLEINGRIARCLCATGYLNEARYPHFVKWVIDKWNDGETVCGSVEFVGTLENDGEIIYDGGWKREGRIPMVYDYSGYCILSIRPSDSAAILVELNQSLDKETKIMEESEMNEEMKSVLAEFKSEVIGAVKSERDVETNALLAEKDSKISELNQKIENMTAELADKDSKIAGLTEQVATVEANACQEKEELNAQIAEMKATSEATVAELNELKKANRIAELNSALSKYTDEQKGYAKEEINAFEADPFSVEINSITEKIDAASYRKLQEASEAKRLAELNSKNEFEDIMASVDPVFNDKAEVEDFSDVFA